MFSVKSSRFVRTHRSLVGLFFFSCDAALEALQRGSLMRATGSTLMNATSSRSHGKHSQFAMRLSILWYEACVQQTH